MKNDIKKQFQEDFEAGELNTEALKKAFGDVFVIEVENGKKCYLHKPTRQMISLSISKTDPLQADEVLLKNCWIAGDEEIKENLDLFLSVHSLLAELVEIKKAEIKKI